MSSPSIFPQVVEEARGHLTALERSLMKMLLVTPSQDLAPEKVGLSRTLLEAVRSAIDLSKTQYDSSVAPDHLVRSVIRDPQVQQARRDASVPNIALIETSARRIRTGERGARKPLMPNH